MSELNLLYILHAAAKNRGMRLLLRLATLLIPICVQAQTSLTADPPRDSAHPAAMLSVQIPSHGVLMNGFVYLASSDTPHPTVILLHGLPGNERSLDIGQAMRRVGWNVLFFDYRGSWGTAGQFSFTHCIEDAEAAIAWLREPSTTAKLHSDPTRIVLLGHSLGGFVANEAAANTAGILGVITLSAVDMNASKLVNVPASQHAALAKTMAPLIEQQGLAPLSGCDGESLARDVLANAPQWVFPAIAPRLARTPYLAFTADDGWTETNEDFISALKKAGNSHVLAIHLKSDHFYSDQRITLQKAIMEWTARLN